MTDNDTNKTKNPSIQTAPFIIFKYFYRIANNGYRSVAKNKHNRHQEVEGLI